jgi:release factor glutamine methyltransferase
VRFRPYASAVTVLEVIQRSAEYLARKGVESPRLNAEELLAHVLNWPRLQLYLHFEKQLTPREEEAARALVQRRGKREPLQHLLGKVVFCGLELAVNRHALIPRPETELLAETAWQQLSSVASDPPTVLDFGTGTGCLAVALAVKVPRAKVVALDVSEPALDLARQNAETHGVVERIQFVCGDGWTGLPGSETFDLMVSNPPYIPSQEIEILQPEVRDHDPHLALDGGADGLDFYRQMAREAVSRLKPGGKIMAEFGDGQKEAVGELFKSKNWVVEAIIEDYDRRPRILVASHP